MSTYTMKYRPPDSFTCPKGWVLLERGKEDHFRLRTDVPVGPTRFGIIGYERMLTPEELAAYEMVPATLSKV